MVEWKTTTLGELCQSSGGDIQTGPFGSQLHASDYVPIGIPSVMPQNIGDNVIREDGIARITPFDAQRLSRYLLREGDIVYSRRGDVERRALVRAAQDGWLCGTGCLRVRFGKSVDSRFVSYQLGAPAAREWIVRHAVGATMPNLNTSILGALPITVPPIAIQASIATVLGALDDKIAVNDQISAKVDELAAQLLEKSLESSLYDVRQVSLGTIADVNRSKITPRADGHLRYIDISSVSIGAFEWPQRITWPEAPGRARRGVSYGDTMWSTVRPSRRSHALVLDDNPELVASTGLAVLTPTTVGPAFLYEVTKRAEFTSFLESVAEGSTYPAVRAEKFAQAVVPMLPNDKMRSFEDKAIALRRRSHLARMESRTLTALRDTMLPKLMSEELRVRDAERVVEDAV